MPPLQKAQLVQKDSDKGITAEAAAGQSVCRSFLLWELRTVQDQFAEQVDTLRGWICPEDHLARAVIAWLQSEEGYPVIENAGLMSLRPEN